MNTLQFNTVKSSTEFSRRNGFGENFAVTAVGVAEGDTKTLLIDETRTKRPYTFRESDRSRTLEELQIDPIFGPLWQPPQADPPSPLETARNQRLAILAREFEGVRLSREDEARLAILTQRLRRLAPKVTVRSWTVAEEVLAQLEDVSARINDISAKYGL